jgi:hypothetical protein
MDKGEQCASFIGQAGERKLDITDCSIDYFIWVWE